MTRIEPVDHPVDPFAPASLGPITLRNRIIKAATFEGLTPQHVASPALVDFHTRIAEGGVGMTTVAYLAVSREGCGTPNEIVLTDDAVDGLGHLAESVHAAGAAVQGQIGHAGPVAAATRLPAHGPTSKFLPMAFQRMRALDRADIARVTQDFADAATRLARAGFDAVELHLGHGYLLSSFLSPKFNTRTDEWGGSSLENRARFPRRVCEAVADAVGDSMAVTAKLNMVDGVPGGLWLDESIEVARMLEADGTLDALQLTAGSSLENPMYLFKGDVPLREMSKALGGVLGLGMRLVGSRFLRSYPYSEAFHLDFARQFRAALELPIIYLGGVSDRATVDLALAEGFDFVAMGRALLREPDLPARMAHDADLRSLCIHCNKCMPTIYVGTHCPLLPEAERPGVVHPGG